jgi:uncharacterized small protein (DUF1192 family)
LAAENPVAAENPNTENFATTVTEVSDRVSTLIREEIELAKAEVTDKATSIARGAATVAVGAVFGIFALIIGLGTLAWGLNSLFSSLWLGFLVVFGLLILLTAGAMLFAWRSLKVGAPMPNMAIDEAKKIRATVTAKAEGER